VADFIKFDGVDGEIENASDQPNPPSWGLDRVDQRDLPVQNADPFFAYGDGFLGGADVPTAPGQFGLSIMLAPVAPPAPADGIVMVTPILDPAEIGLRYHAEFIFG
jgi:hypothetical protein